MCKRILHMTGPVALAAPAFAAVEWSTDLEAAKVHAASSGKSILVDFTCSD